VIDPDPKNNFNRWGQCSGVNNAKGKDEDCSVDLKYGMKRDFNAWLKTLGDRAPVASLTELREWNLRHTTAGAIRYGQANLDISDEMDLRADRARYEADRAKDLKLAGERGLKAALDANHVDALFFPGWNVSGIASRVGFPEVVVPIGFVPNAPEAPFPAGFDAKPIPSAVAFVGDACSDPKLFGFAYAFEQATKKRVPPQSTR